MNNNLDLDGTQAPPRLMMLYTTEHRSFSFCLHPYFYPAMNCPLMYSSSTTAADVCFFVVE